MTDSPTEITLESHVQIVLEAVAKEATALFGSEVTLSKPENCAWYITLFRAGPHSVECRNDKQFKAVGLGYRPDFKPYPQFRFLGLSTINGRTFKRKDKHDPKDPLSGYPIANLAEYVVRCLKLRVANAERSAKVNDLAQQAATAKATYEASLTKLLRGRALSNVVTTTAAGYCFRIDTTDEALLARLLDCLSES